MAAGALAGSEGGDAPDGSEEGTGAVPLAHLFWGSPLSFLDLFDPRAGPVVMNDPAEKQVMETFRGVMREVAGGANTVQEKLKEAFSLFQVSHAGLVNRICTWYAHFFDLGRFCRH